MKPGRKPEPRNLSADDLLVIAWLRRVLVTGEARDLRSRARIGARELSEGLAINVSTVSRAERGLDTPGLSVSLQWGTLLMQLEDSGLTERGPCVHCGAEP